MITLKMIIKRKKFNRKLDSVEQMWHNSIPSDNFIYKKEQSPIYKKYKINGIETINFMAN